jgi:hypothetical protein
MIGIRLVVLRVAQPSPHAFPESVSSEARSGCPGSLRPACEARFGPTATAKTPESEQRERCPDSGDA